MENDILNKCVTQGNNLVKVCTGLHQRLLKVEEQNAKLVQVNTALVQRVVKLEETLASFPDKLDAITKTVESISAKASKKDTKRVPRTYEMYQQVMKAQEGGMSMKLIAKELGIPYTTVVSYFKLSQEDIDALPHEEPADAEIPESV